MHTFVEYVKFNLSVLFQTLKITNQCLHRRGLNQVPKVQVQVQLSGEKIEEPVRKFLCHTHYNSFHHFKSSNKNPCFICDKLTNKTITIIDENLDIFEKYIEIELKFETKSDRTKKVSCCALCNNSFNQICRSEAAEDVLLQTDKFLQDIIPKFKFDDTVSENNIDIYTVYKILTEVVSFLQEEAILLPVLFERYKCALLRNINKFDLILSLNLKCIN